MAQVGDEPGRVALLLVAAVAIYVKPKGKQDGVVITLKTDADRFLASILAAMPDVIHNATLAALYAEPPTPAPTNMTPVATVTVPTFAGQVATANLTNVNPVAVVAGPSTASTPDTILSLQPTPPVA